MKCANLKAALGGILTASLLALQVHDASAQTPLESQVQIMSPGTSTSNSGNTIQTGPSAGQQCMCPCVCTTNSQRPVLSAANLQNAQSPTRIEPIVPPGPANDDPYKAEAGPLTLMNCSGGAITVSTYSPNDGKMYIAARNVTIGAARAERLSCGNSSTCRLKIGTLTTWGLGGYHVLAHGRISPTNQIAMSKGCGVYR